MCLNSKCNIHVHVPILFFKLGGGGSYDRVETEAGKRIMYPCSDYYGIICMYTCHVVNYGRKI